MYLTEEEYLALLGRLDILEKKKLKVDDLPMNDIAAQIQDQADWKGADVLLKKSVTTALLKDGAVDSNKIAATPFCDLRNSVVQNMIGSTATAITFDTEVEDLTGMHDSGAPTRITIATPGVYLFSGFLGVTTGPVIIELWFQINGVATKLANDSPGSAYRNQTHLQRRMARGDYIQFYGAQYGATQNATVGSTFTAKWLGN